VGSSGPAPLLPPEPLELEEAPDEPPPLLDPLELFEPLEPFDPLELFEPLELFDPLDPLELPEPPEPLELPVEPLDEFEPAASVSPGGAFTSCWPQLATKSSPTAARASVNFMTVSCGAAPRSWPTPVRYQRTGMWAQGGE
jgi:hypothetical protein